MSRAFGARAPSKRRAFTSNVTRTRTRGRRQRAIARARATEDDDGSKARARARDGAYYAGFARSPLVDNERERTTLDVLTPSVRLAFMSAMACAMAFGGFCYANGLNPFRR